MATEFIPNSVSGLTLEAQFTRIADGFIWSSGAWADPTGLNDTATELAIVALTAVTNSEASHLGYLLTIPGGIVVPCHIAVFVGGTIIGVNPTYEGDYLPRAGELLGHTVQTGDTYALANGGTGFAAIAGYLDTEITTIITAVGTTLNNHLLDIKGTGFEKDTHSLPQCLTATGFSTHDAAAVWAVGTRILTANTNLNDPTAAVIADAVWDEAIADHVGVGSTGAALNTSGDPWSTVLPGAYGAGTAGEILGDWLNGGRLDVILDAVSGGGSIVLTTEGTFLSSE